MLFASRRPCETTIPNRSAATHEEYVFSCRPRRRMRSPEVAPLYPIDDPKLNGILRKKVVISFRRYLVFYTVTEEEILILYVHAGSLPLEQRSEEEPSRV
jgi:hypothetical protein